MILEDNDVKQFVDKESKIVNKITRLSKESVLIQERLLPCDIDQLPAEVRDLVNGEITLAVLSQYISRCAGFARYAYH